MICIEIADSGERIKIDREIWVTENRNGILRTRYRCKALGVSDGSRIWSLGELKSFPGAKIITLAEYDEEPLVQEPDPELSAEEALNIILGGSYESE